MDDKQRQIDLAKMNEEGFVFIVAPAFENIRLSHQSGVFLTSGAPAWTFEESLVRMMGPTKPEWFRQIEVPQALAEPLIRRLLQMNIHDLTLFPDGYGLLALS